ncbi:LamB/YcsF family protein (plasmid) [Rhizobium sp. NIBRBAC000502774]|nr:LamB/YcsF family protein [Rhizobium sp. NIBRBAC000502774]
MQIDINCDLGEGFGRWRLVDDAKLMGIVSSANIACGYHAGDPSIMSEMVGLAKVNGVAIGAHIGLPDLAGFGRVRMKIPLTELRQHAIYQFGALSGIARTQDATVGHFSFHGALGNMSSEDPELARTLVDAIADLDMSLMIATSPRGHTYRAARARGLRTVGKLLVDRAYTAEGKLVSRSLAGAVITDPQTIRRRVEQYLGEGTVEAITGENVTLDAQTILIHGDSPSAVEIATIVRDAIESSGAAVVPFTQNPRHEG